MGREVPGGEVLGMLRWGGAPTMARPAGNGRGAMWWSVEAGAKWGGPAAGRPGGGSRRAAPKSTSGAVTRPNLAAPMAQQLGAPRASSAACAQGSDGAGGERASTGPRARGSRRGRGDEGPDEIASPWEVGPSTVLDNATARRIRGIRALILRGRCPRQRSISPGAARWQRKREPRSKP